MTIAVIGAGASGMAAALQAARLGKAVTVFERNSIPGRKLLVTGSGRCNITNQAASPTKYDCASTQWMDSMMSAFGVKHVLDMLHDICIAVYMTDDGWYYPLSNSAHTVVDAFACALSMAGVNMIMDTQVTGIGVSANGFIIHAHQEKQEIHQTFDKVIVATGGMAYPALGSTGELFPLLKHLGHKLIPKRPALAPVLADMRSMHSLQGVRLDCAATLWQGKKKLTVTRGNLIFTRWGLNGPAVMDLSHHISSQPEHPLTLSLNLLEFFKPQYDELVQRKRHSSTPLRVLLGAFFPPKITHYLLNIQDIAPESTIGQLDDAAFMKLNAQLENLHIRVKGVRGFEYCQASAGGIPVNETNPQTLESLCIKNLYLTGETLDVVGPCGGYNLQFAFSSGALAGKAAVRI